MVKDGLMLEESEMERVRVDFLGIFLSVIFCLLPVVCDVLYG